MRNPAPRPGAHGSAETRYESDTPGAADHIPFVLSPDSSGDGPPSQRGHLPLLWLLLPLLAVYSICFAFDLQAPLAGGALLFTGGGAALFLSLRHPAHTRLWSVAFLTGMSGLALLLFALNVPPLPDWRGLPPREAELTLRWQQVFAVRPDAPNTSGVARVLVAPALLPELVGNDVYCQLRNPVPAVLTETGAIFRVTGVLDTSRRRIEFANRSAAERQMREEAKALKKTEQALKKGDYIQLAELAKAGETASARTTRAAPLPSSAATGLAAPAPAQPAPASTGGDSFLRYLESRRATMSLSRARLGSIVQEPAAFRLWCSRQRARLEGVLQHGIEAQPDAYALYAAILLRKTSGIERDVRDAFARTGTAHLFSVSGLHVGVIAAALFWFGRLLRTPDTLWRLVVIVVMFGFVMVTGGSPAALRAWLMASCMLASRFAPRGGGSGSGLILAATGALLWEPRLLLDIGFQLSYGVVAALVFYGIPLADWIKEHWVPWADLPLDAGAGGGAPKARRGVFSWLRLPVLSFDLWRRFVLRVRDWLASGVGIGAASMLAGSPLIITHFNLFSAGSMFANLIVVPIAFPVMVLGFASVALGVCGLEAVVAPVNWLAGWNLWFLERVTRLFAAIPGMSYTLEYRAAWVGPLTALVLFVVFLALPFSKRSHGWLFFIPPVLLALSLLAGAKG